MTTNDAEADDSSAILPRQKVIYCGACGMPPEYCEYGPDFETHCDPWLKKHHPELHADLATKRGASAACRPASSKNKPAEKEEEQAPKPERPWTTEERLTAFYQKYEPGKLDSIPSLLEKYEGKEDKLFFALVKKYGNEPDDPYYADSDSDEDDDEDDEEEGAAGATSGDGTSSKKKKRRGVGAKKEADAGSIRVVVQKVAQKKRRNLTIISGMETVPKLKLKDASKAFSKKFAGSSSVKANVTTGKDDIIIQGDHMYDVAEMIVDKFNVPESCVYLDMDGTIVPLR